MDFGYDRWCGSPFGNGFFWNRGGGTLTEVVSGVPEIAASAEEYIYGDLTYAYLDDGTIKITDCKTSVTEVEIPAEIDGVAVTSIGEYAFYDCSSLTSITIPDSVTSIGSGAFLYCDSLTSIIVDDSNSDYCSVDGVLFDKNLETLVCYPAGKTNTSYAIPDSVTNIEDFAFYDCDSLTSVTIPDGVTYIGYSAFEYCSNLEEITIPDGITQILDLTFCVCTSLKTITIPASVVEIRWAAFSDCSNLTDVYYSGTQENWNEISIAGNADYFTSQELKAAVIHCSDGIIDDSLTTTTTTTTATTTIDTTTESEDTTTTTTSAKTADLDGDDAITISDAFLCLTAYANSAAGNDSGLTAEQEAVADVDGDGSITIMDASYILQFYAQTAAGNSVTWDDLLP